MILESIACKDTLQFRKIGNLQFCHPHHQEEAGGSLADQLNKLKSKQALFSTFLNSNALLCSHDVAASEAKCINKLSKHTSRLLSLRGTTKKMLLDNEKQAFTIISTFALLQNFARLSHLTNKSEKKSFSHVHIIQIHKMWPVRCFYETCEKKRPTQ